MARIRDLANTAVNPSASAGMTCETTGQGGFYRTEITINTTLGAIAGGAALGLGKLLVTLPAGDIIVTGSKLDVALQQTEGNVTADTPDIGLGTTVASGVVSVLGGTAAFENIHTGQTAADCDGTATVNTLGTQLVIEAADSHGVYLNVADTWASSGEAAMEVSGTVILHWMQVEAA